MELLIAMALIGIIITLSVSMILFSNRSHAMVVNEYEIQSSIRMAMDETNRIVRYSSALFSVPKDYFHLSDMTKLDKGWHYFGVSADKKSILKYTYVVSESVGSHVVRTVVPPIDNVEYELVFEKTHSASDEKILKMKIVAYVMNGSVRTNKKFEIETEVEALNAIQVIDKGTNLSPAIALAFRGEERPIGKEVVAAISMVLDVSGSMNEKLDGTYATVVEDRRIEKVKNALVGYTYDGIMVEGMVNEFAKEDNIEISMVPFSYTGNYDNPVSETVKNGGKHPFYSVSRDASQKDDLIDKIEDLEAAGGTNTGDGMRQAYYRNIKFVTENAVAQGYSSNAEVRNYMIILVDGETTIATANGNSVYKLDDGPVTSISRSYSDSTTFNHVGIIGNGNTPSDNTENYVKVIGDMIRTSNIKVYVIGYAPGITDGINLIATKTGAIKVYNYSDDMNLDEIFSEIKVNIMEDIWHIAGPQILN